jgi:hypothetical protein
LWVTQMRSNLHLEEKYQIDKLAISRLSSVEQNRLDYLFSFIKIMKCSLEHYLDIKNFQRENYSLPEFNLDNVVDTYFHHRLSLTTGKGNHGNWFREITQFLLYTKEPIHRHRYFYRLLPEEFQSYSIEYTKSYLSDHPDRSYWPNEEDFWVKLWDTPSKNGERKSHQKLKMRWKEKLSTLVVSDDIVKKDAMKVYVHGIKIGKVALNNVIVKDLRLHGWIDGNGKFVQKKQHPVASFIPGNHLVIPWPLPEKPEKILNQKDKTANEIRLELIRYIQSTAQFYFKVYPEFPLADMFLNELSYKLGYCAPREVDVWLWQCERYAYPILISEAVSGSSLQESLEKNDAIILNPYSFSQSVVTSALMSLEDNKPDNIILTNESDGARLCLIDADRWFAPAFKVGQLHAKDIVFCLNAMDDSFSPLFIEEFLNLNPQYIVQTWINEIENLGKKCKKIFKEKIQEYYDRNDNTRKTLLLPPLPFHAVNELFHRMQVIQNCLILVSGTSSVVSHRQVSAKVNLRLASHYSNACEQFPGQPINAFDSMVGHAYLNVKGLHKDYFQTRPSDFKTEMMDMWGEEEEAKRVRLGIQKSWDIDIKIAKEQVATLNEKELVIADAEQELLKGNLQQFSMLGSKGKETILQRLDWSALGYQKQRELLKHLKINGHWLKISIRNSSALNDEDVQYLIKKSSEIIKLKLNACSQLTYSIFSELTMADSLLKIIILKNLGNLKYIGYISDALYAERCLNFPNLEKLDVRNCPNLEQIHIYAVLLKEVYLETLPKLKVLQTASQNLETLQILKNTRWPSLNNFHRICDRNFAANLNVFISDDNIIADLYTKIPVLIGIYSIKEDAYALEKFIHCLSKKIDHINEKINYLRIPYSVRKILLEQAQKLFNYFNELFKKNVIDALVEGLRDYYRFGRMNTALALASLEQYSDKVIEVLSELANLDFVHRTEGRGVFAKTTEQRIETDPYFCCMKESALIALGDFDEPTSEIVDTICRNLHSISSSVKLAAVSALRNFSKPIPEVIEALIASLNDGCQTYGIVAAVALTYFGENFPEVRETLNKAAESSYKFLVVDGVYPLVQFREINSSNIDILMSMLWNLGLHPDTRRWCAASIGNLTRRQVSEYRSFQLNIVIQLEHLFSREPNRMVHNEIGSALLQLRKNHGYYYNVLPYQPNEIRIEPSISKHSENELLSHVKSLRDDDYDVRCAASSSLQKLIGEFYKNMVIFAGQFEEFIHDECLSTPIDKSKPLIKLAKPIKYTLFGDAASQMLISVKQWENTRNDKKESEEQLANHAKRYGYQCIDVPGYGNCFFHAMVHQLNVLLNLDISYEQVRERVANHILKNFDRYKNFKDEIPNQFILRMRQDRSWVGHIMALAVSSEFNLRLIIVQSDGSNPIIIPQANHRAQIVLGYDVDSQYQPLLRDESVVPEEGCNFGMSGSKLGLKLTL